ncbi:piercer of microtubule wall 2 protein-like isoform X1 [Liolophura sinensis]|uniref:piercer of microtubule wall 2 protein-like isoform X1 n=1 Tax=Liolophura sinensis TaxID=3198878 RepID=UPI0031598FB4
MAETGTQQTTQPEDTQVYGPGGVPKGVCSLAGNPIFTCASKIETPDARQPRPDEWFEGYNTIPQNPLYRTTNNSYGNRPPTVHTMPTSFHAKSQKFSKHLGTCGMYRNHSLNTGMDQSRV